MSAARDLLEKVGIAAKPRDVLVTGLPRSGTTLIVHLLHGLPDTVALDEPMGARPFLTGAGPEELAREVDAFLREQRRSLLERGVAVSFQAKGEVPDNSVGTERDASGRRTNRGVTKGEIRVTKPLSRDFLLVVKHNASFTAILEPLARRRPTFAVVRNPLAVLASWHSVALPVGRGRLPTAEAIDATLARDLEREDDVLARQLHILDWFCRRFRDVLGKDRVVRYEDVVASRGAALRVVDAKAASLDESLESRNRNPLYDSDAMRATGRRLLETDGAWWSFYGREAVEELLG